MRGLNVDVPITIKEKQVESLLFDFKQTVILIVRQFIELLTTNRLLGVEAVFRFSSRELKEDILTNYEHTLGSHRNDESNASHLDNNDYQEEL